MFTKLPSFLELPGYLNYLGNLGITRLFGNYQVILQITRLFSRITRLFCKLPRRFASRSGALGWNLLRGMGYPLVPAVCPALAEPAPPLAKALAEPAPPLAKAWLSLPQAMDLWRTDIRKFAPMVLCFPIAPRCVLWRWRQSGA